jgi:hypothetical protein
MQRSSPERAEQIELTVLVYDTSYSRPIYKDMCKSSFVPAPVIVFNHDALLVPVEASTRLSAVRWIVAGALEESPRRRARQSGEFVLVSSNTTCDLHETVAQYTGPNRKCALQLNI